MGRKISNITLIIIVAVVTIISMTNLQPVSFKILFFSFQTPLTLLFYFTLFTGFLAGYTMKGIVTYRKNKKKESADISAEKGKEKKKKY